MRDEPLKFDLSPKRRKLFDLIISKGREGVPADTLIDRFFDDGTEFRVGGYTTLRTTVHAINGIIKPLRITAVNGSYRLERR
jgi:hypothetical protein